MPQASAFINKVRADTEGRNTKKEYQGAVLNQNYLDALMCSNGVFKPSWWVKTTYDPVCKSCSPSQVYYISNAIITFNTDSTYIIVSWNVAPPVGVKVDIYVIDPILLTLSYNGDTTNFGYANGQPLNILQNSTIYSNLMNNITFSYKITQSNSTDGSFFGFNSANNIFYPGFTYTKSNGVYYFYVQTDNGSLINRTTYTNSDIFQLKLENNTLYWYFISGSTTRLLYSTNSHNQLYKICIDTSFTSGNISLSYFNINSTSTAPRIFESQTASAGTTTITTTGAPSINSSYYAILSPLKLGNPIQTSTIT